MCDLCGPAASGSSCVLSHRAVCEPARIRSTVRTSGQPPVRCLWSRRHRLAVLPPNRPSSDVSSFRASAVTPTLPASVASGLASTRACLASTRKPRLRRQAVLLVVCEHLQQVVLGEWALGKRRGASESQHVSGPVAHRGLARSGRRRLATKRPRRRRPTDGSRHPVTTKSKLRHDGARRRGGGVKKGTLFAPVKIAFETGKVLAINKTSQGRLRCKHRSQNEPPRKSAPKPTPRLHHPHWRDRNRLLFMGIVV